MRADLESLLAMGLRITCPDESAPIPKPTVLVLECDGDHGLFPSQGANFERGGYIEQYAEAMRAGWRESWDRERGRIFLGPCCSGKTPRCEQTSNLC